MTPLFQALLGSLARAALTSLAGYLVAHHVLTSDQSDQFVTKAVAYVLAASPGLLAFAWSLWQKYTSRLKLIAANTLPAGASEDQINAKAKTPAVKAQVFTGVLILVLVAGPAHAQQPVNHWADWASYETAAVSPAIAAVKAWKSPDRSCKLKQLALSEGIGNGLALAMKHFIVSPRPCVGCSPDGMPSGHAMNAMIGVRASWKWGGAAALATEELRRDANRHTRTQGAVGLGLGALAEFAGHTFVHCQEIS